MRSKAMQKLTDEIKARYPGVVIYGVGDDAHKLRYSDHNEDDTAGSKAAQSDPDNIPEHRAIDVMHGPAFTVSQASALIQEIIAVPVNRQRLYYINHLDDQWSRTSFSKHDNSDDPHPDHIHFSGWAPEDDNVANWLNGGGIDVLKATRGMGQNGAPPHDNVMYLQRLMYCMVEGDPRLAEHPLVVDGNYGGNTAFWVSVLLTGGEGNEVNGDWFGTLVSMVSSKRGNQEVAGHLANTQHGGGSLPDTVNLVIPARTIEVPAITVTADVQ